jgi:1-acyl-sn-glycerol-3-phosphate acyltransferase
MNAPAKAARAIARAAFHVLVYPALHFVVHHGLVLFAWYVSHVRNRIAIEDRKTLERAIRRGKGSGRPLFLVMNHVGMVDDPIIPMAAIRSAERAMLTLGAAVALAIAASVTGSAWLAAALVAWVWGLGAFGEHKCWWSIGDYSNFASTAALRANLRAHRAEPFPAAIRAGLAVLDEFLPWFMGSPITKAILVPRQRREEGEEAWKRERARVHAETMRALATGEAVLFFLEGTRARDPEVIGPPKRGTGDALVEVLRVGQRPRVFVIHHRGLERIVPIGGRRWFHGGHRIDVLVEELAPDRYADLARQEDGAERIARDLHGRLVALQARWRSTRGGGAAR